MTAESRRPLGYGLLFGAAGLTILLLLWLATSGAQAGGAVLGLVLVFVLAAPLAGAGWYVLARASADVVEERAFVSKHRVLEADKLFRTQLALELRQLAAAPGLPAEPLRHIAAQLDSTEHDEAARYDAIQLSDAQVALLKQYDDLVWERMRWLRDHGGDNEAKARDAVDQLQQAMDQRSDLLLRGRQAASVEPSVLLQASLRAGSTAVAALDVGDAITYEGSDYVVEALATSFSNGQTWKLAHLVPSGAGSHDNWLSVAPGGLSMAWLERLTPPPQPAVPEIVVRATSLPLAGSRSAVTRVSSTAGAATGVLVRSWDYRAGSLVGLVEEWADGSVHAYGGRSITPDAVQVWPANSYQQTADGFKQQYEEQARQVAELKKVLGQLETKITEADTKKDLLLARSRRASAETNIRTMLSGLDQSGAQASFERMEEKVRQQEARAAALAEVETDSAESRFATLETADEVERQLAALNAKKAIASPAEATALPAG